VSPDTKTPARHLDGNRIKSGRLLAFPLSSVLVAEALL
jgi:hypothetical protein